MKNATKSNNYEISEKTLKSIVSMTTEAVIATLEARGYISPAQKEEPKAKKQTKKTSAKVTKVTKKVTKEGNKTSGQVRYCHRNDKGNLVISKKPTSKKVTKKSGWQYIKNADGTVTVKKS